MASTDARPVPRKGVAYRVTFPILDADGDLVTGAASLDSEVSKDHATFADCTNEATEIATASGMYFLDLTATEMDADTVAIIVKTATAGANTTPIVLYPEELGDYRVDSVAQTGDSFARLGAPAGASVSADIAAAQAAINAIDDFLDTEIAAILEDTGTTLPTQIAALENLSAAEVNAEVVDALATDTYPESAGVPAATASIVAKLSWLATLARNKITQTATTQTLRNDADAGDVATAAVSDDGATFIRGEWT